MTMRFLTGVIIVTFLLPLAALGQNVDSTDRLDKRLAELQKELKLTDEQTVQLRRIFEEARPPRPDGGGAPGPRDSAQGQDRRGRWSELNEKIQSILTEKQWEKYQEYERSRRMANQLEALTEALGLTEKQVVQVETILDYFQDRMEEMFSGGGDQQDMRKAMQKLREAQDKEIEEILTDDQQDLYDNYKNERREQMRNRRPGGGGRP